MILVETSETGGEWSAKFDNNLDFVWLCYNGRSVSKRILNTRWEEVVWNFFDERYDLDTCYRKYLYQRDYADLEY